jgi:hypothetical protein
MGGDFFSSIDPVFCSAKLNCAIVVVGIVCHYTRLRGAIPSLHTNGCSCSIIVFVGVWLLVIPA